jgi:MFS family permease
VSVNLNRFIDVLRTPGVARVVAFSLVGRIPFATVGLSMILLMRHEGYGYGDVGLVVGGESLAIALTAGLVGRLADRAGRSRVILILGWVTSIALSGETVAILAGAPVGLLVVLSAVYGGTIPPISASTRSMLGRLVPEDRVETAYAFDAVQLEIVFIVGPLVAAGIATLWTPTAGLLMSAALYVVAAVGFGTAPAVRAEVPDADAVRTRAGPLGSPGIRTLIAAAMAAAISFGAIEVALPAFTESEGSRAVAGPLLTLWALGSVIGGIWYGSRTWTSPADRRLVVLSVLLTLGTAPIVFAWSIPSMAVLLVFTGLALAPLATTEYTLVDRLAPLGTSTEAYSWHIAATGTGFGLGSLIAGLLVEHASVPWALGSAALACAVAMFVIVGGRRTLSPEAETV